MHKNKNITQQQAIRSIKPPSYTSGSVNCNSPIKAGNNHSDKWVHRAETFLVNKNWPLPSHLAQSINFLIDYDYSCQHFDRIIMNMHMVACMTTKQLPRVSNLWLTKNSVNEKRRFVCLFAPALHWKQYTLAVVSIWCPLHSTPPSWHEFNYY